MGAAEEVAAPAEDAEAELLVAAVAEDELPYDALAVFVVEDDVAGAGFLAFVFEIDAFEDAEAGESPSGGFDGGDVERVAGLESCLAVEDVWAGVGGAFVGDGAYGVAFAAAGFEVDDDGHGVAEAFAAGDAGVDACIGKAETVGFVADDAGLLVDPRAVVDGVEGGLGLGLENAVFVDGGL